MGGSENGPFFNAWKAAALEGAAAWYLEKLLKIIRYRLGQGIGGIYYSLIIVQISVSCFGASKPFGINTIPPTLPSFIPPAVLVLLARNRAWFHN